MPAKIQETMAAGPASLGGKHRPEEPSRPNHATDGDKG